MNHVTGVVEIDLSIEPAILDEGRDRRALACLFRCPDGASVRIVVGSRTFVSPELSWLLGDLGDRLALEIVGTTPEAVRAFLSALRPGNADDVVATGTYAERVLRQVGA